VKIILSNIMLFMVVDLQCTLQATPCSLMRRAASLIEERLVLTGLFALLFLTLAPELDAALVSLLGR
jgi:hypothetical protein